MVTLNCDDLGKDNLLLATHKLDYWGHNMNDGIFPQFAASLSSMDSESVDVNDEVCDLLPVKEELVTSGDPSWVARPRNAFIIFRCEYARRHSRMNRGVKRGTGPTSEKSLSKRAAEAWHQLPSEEKLHFKMLADQERLEHARLHPDYRFRPARRVLPPRVIHPRNASSSNSIKQRPGDGVTAKPKSSRGLPSPSASTSSAGLSNSSPQGGSDHLYPSPDHQQDSTESSRLTSSFSNGLSCEAMKALASADLDSCNLVGPLYSHLEGVLPQIPQRGRNVELCPLQHPMPKCAAAPSSVLMDWDGITTDNWTASSNPKERNSPMRGVIASTCLPEDPFENVCMDMQYHGYGDPYTSHLECLCSDFLDSHHPTVVASHPQTMYSSYFSINH